MGGIGEYLLVIGVSWAVRTIADIGVKHSKRTENTVDDVIFNNFKKVISMDLFRTKDLDWIKEKGDAALDWDKIIKGWGGNIAEAGDGIVIGLFSKQVNKWLSPQLDDSLKQELHDVFDKVIASDYKEALIELSDVGVYLANHEKIPVKLKPWLSAFIEIYKGIINQLID